jgi:hypothetical protein
MNRIAKPENIKPEWIRIPQAMHISGMCRSVIYQLINSGAIKSFCHKKPGALTGLRLISYDSLVNYLNRAYRTSSDK